MLKETLIELGATEEQLTKLEAGEITPAEIKNDLVEKAKEIVKNDLDFRLGLITPEINKIIGTLDNDIKKRFGLKPEDLAGKKIHEKLDLIAAATKASATGSDESKELQAKLEEALNAVKKYEDEVLPEKDRQFESEKKQWHYTLEFAKIWDAVAQEKVLIDKAVARGIIEQHINLNYDAKINADNTITYVKKGTTDIYPQFGNEIVKTPDKLVEAVLKQLKLNKENNASGGGGQQQHARTQVDVSKARTNSKDGLVALEKRKAEMEAKGF